MTQYSRTGASFAVLLTSVAIYYLFLLSNGTFQLFAPEMLDKAFDNMLLHLLRGEFIGYEAFTRDDKTYAYFGIFPVIPLQTRQVHGMF